MDPADPRLLPPLQPGFDKLAAGYGWFAARIVRVAVVMLVAYAAILGYGLNEFRKTPAGFIPQQDAGYLIGVTQLPAGASLARTDEVNRRVVDIALKTPGVAHAVNIVGFSGATFTNAPNAGAVFFVLEPFEERAGIRKVRRRHPGRAVPAACRHPGIAGAGGAAAAGARRRQCRRRAHDDPGPCAAAARRSCKAPPTP